MAYVWPPSGGLFLYGVQGDPPVTALGKSDLFLYKHFGRAIPKYDAHQF